MAIHKIEIDFLIVLQLGSVTEMLAQVAPPKILLLTCKQPLYCCLLYMSFPRISSYSCQINSRSIGLRTYPLTSSFHQWCSSVFKHSHSQKASACESGGKQFCQQHHVVPKLLLFSVLVQSLTQLSSLPHHKYLPSKGQA